MSHPLTLISLWERLFIPKSEQVTTAFPNIIIACSSIKKISVWNDFSFRNEYVCFYKTGLEAKQP